MQLLSILQSLVQRWALHDNSRSAAVIAFFGIFTLAPMLVFVTAGVGLMIGDQQAQALTESQLTDTMGESGGRIAQEILANADFGRQGLLPTSFTALLLLYGASAVFFHLRNALDRIFGGAHGPETKGLVQILLGRLVATTTVIIATLLLVSSLLAQVVINALAERPMVQPAFSESTWQSVSTSATVLIVSLLVVLLLHFLPTRRPGWRHVLLGTLVTVILFELGKWLVGMYISRSVVASAYGPSSALVAFVLWIYFSSQVFILGAEVCQLSVERAAQR